MVSIPETDQRVTRTLGRLAFAYSALLSQGDTARAAIILREYQALYNTQSDSVRSVLRSSDPPANWMLPTSVQLPFDNRARVSMIPALVFLMGSGEAVRNTSVQNAALAMPEAEGLVGRWYAERLGILRPYFGAQISPDGVDMWPQFDAFRQLASNTSVSQLPTAIHQAVVLGTGTMSSGPQSPIPSPSPGVAPPAPTAPVVLPGARSLVDTPSAPMPPLPCRTGAQKNGWTCTNNRWEWGLPLLSRRYTGLPLWGWVGIIGAVVIGGSIIGYGAYKRAKR